MIQNVVFQFARAVLDIFPKVRPALVETVVEIRGADESLRGGIPGRAEGDLCVEAADAVGANDAAIISAGRVGHRSELAICRDEPDAGSLAAIALQSKHT